MSDWETANENRLERAEEKRRGFDQEIKIEHDVTGKGLDCDAEDCKSKAIHSYNIGPVSATYFMTVSLCAEHDSNEIVWEIYRDCEAEAADDHDD